MVICWGKNKIYNKGYVEVKIKYTTKVMQLIPVITYSHRKSSCQEILSALSTNMITKRDFTSLRHKGRLKHS